MKDFINILMIGLPVWWTAMTALGLRDYFRRRRETKEKGPLNEQEREEVEQVRAVLPRKEMKPAWWYFFYPKEGARLGGTVLLVLPFAVIFLPMVLIMILLPNPNRK